MIELGHAADKADAARELEIRLGMEAAQGDVSSFDTLYQEYFPRIQRMIGYKFGENPPSEDIAQDAFVKVYAAIVAKKYEHRGAGGLYGWIATIAINRALDIKRRHARIDMMPVDFSDGYFDRPSADDFTEQIASQDRVDGILQMLSPERREVIQSVFIDGDTYEQFAEDHNVKLGTVRSRIFRGRNELSELVADRQLNVSRRKPQIGMESVPEIFRRGALRARIAACKQLLYAMDNLPEDNEFPISQDRYKELQEEIVTLETQLKDKSSH